jgi:tetratricopeptide (TPR) repeat protein
MTPTTSIDTEASVLKSEADRIHIAVKQVLDDGIKNDAQYRKANEMILVIAEARERFEEFFRPDIQRAHLLHKSLIAKMKRFTDPLQKWRDALEYRMTIYDQERQKAEEKQRKELERLAEEAKKEAERQAKLLARQGRIEEAQDLIFEAEEMPPPIVVSTSAPLEGLGRYEKPPEVEVTDPMALVMAVVEGRVPIEVIDFRLSVIRRQAIAMGNSFNWPGIKIKREYGFRRKAEY